MTIDNGRKTRVLFLCTNNAARSQMAEGLLRNLYGDHYDAYSAGAAPTKVNPYAKTVMNELGYDISGQRSKSLEQYLDTDMDIVVTLCDDQNATCPAFPGGKQMHQPFRDPARYAGNDQEMLQIFRQVRNDIQEWIEQTFGRGNTAGNAAKATDKEINNA